MEGGNRSPPPTPCTPMIVSSDLRQSRRARQDERLERDRKFQELREFRGYRDIRDFVNNHRYLSKNYQHTEKKWKIRPGS